MTVTFETVRPFSVARTQLDKAEEKRLLASLSQGNRAAFWILWNLHQDYLYSRCLSWMGGNPSDAEEALSRATLKAWDKLPDYAEKITNPRAWLTRLTHNLCVDIHRERSRGAKNVECIEEILGTEQELMFSRSYSPEAVVMRQELERYLCQAIAELPSRLKDVFILRCCQEMSYSAIAQRLGLKEATARKRLQQARSRLQRQLNVYLRGTTSKSIQLRHLLNYQPANQQPPKPGKPVSIQSDPVEKLPVDLMSWMLLDVLKRTTPASEPSCDRQAVLASA